MNKDHWFVDIRWISVACFLHDVIVGPSLFDDGITDASILYWIVPVIPPTLPH